MLIKIVTIYVTESEIKAFIAATRENQRNSIEEDGIEGFDFFQCRDDSSRFMIYEVYSSQQAMDDHLKTAHFKKWHETVSPYLSSPIDRVIYIPTGENI